MSKNLHRNRTSKKQAETHKPAGFRSQKALAGDPSESGDLGHSGYSLAIADNLTHEHSAMPVQSAAISDPRSPIRPSSRVLQGRFRALDLTPLGRQEEWEDSPAGGPRTKPFVWWRRHDEYGKDTGGH